MKKTGHWPAEHVSDIITISCHMIMMTSSIQLLYVIIKLLGRSISMLPSTVKNGSTGACLSTADLHMRASERLSARITSY